MSMKLNLTVSEINALSSAGISFREDGEYSEDEALELLEQVVGLGLLLGDGLVVQGGIAGSPGDQKKLFDTYAAIGDKLFAQIPEE